MSVWFDVCPLPQSNHGLKYFSISKAEEDLREQVRVLKNKLALVGKKEAKKRNKIERSLRHELLAVTKKKHKAPMKLVAPVEAGAGGEEEEERDEPSVSSESGISKVVRFQWSGEGEERVGWWW